MKVIPIENGKKITEDVNYAKGGQKVWSISTPEAKNDNELFGCVHRINDIESKQQLDVDSSFK